MNVLAALRDQFGRLGYPASAVAAGYRFADMLTEHAPERVVPLAVFTDTPFSYRNSAFGVLTDCLDPAAQIRAHRALGAGVWLCVQGDSVEVWNTRDLAGPVRESVHPLAELDRLFAAQREAWAPDRIHLAQLAGSWDTPDQRGLFEVPGLLKLIEVHTQSRLDRIITRTLQTLASPQRAAVADYRRAYRACFYFVAAKIILDRGHPVGQAWPADDATGILDAIASHYGLPYAADPAQGIASARLKAAWAELRDEVSFANVSADDLAFVYENTLVSPQTRLALGTHSTPRAVAEFLVSRLDLGRGADAPRIYEPFCGAGVLLVAALARVRRQLPRDWSAAQRHGFLVSRLRGADADPFACEVASLSLILADYPSSNGWDIRPTDLFAPGALASHLEPDLVVLCNPPFEYFTPAERARYPDAVAVSVHKPIQVLTTVLAARPAAIGFVMPQAVLTDTRYAPLRQQLERQFSTLETVSLPDRVFVQADFESALLIARDPVVSPATRKLTVRSATVGDAQRDDFLSGEHRPAYRVRERWSEPTSPTGHLWVSALADVWDWLADYPRLRAVAELHRGLEWQSGHQAQAVAHTPLRGFRAGVHSSAQLCQFAPLMPAFLDCRPEHIRRGALALPWNQPKVVLNAARKTRGAWRLAATVDREGLVLSQQLFGCWPQDTSSAGLWALAAILNSPLASAFVGVHNPRKGFRLELIADLPIPRDFDPVRWAPLIEKVRRASESRAILQPASGAALTAALLELDAAVLAAYALPARLERQLLAYFHAAPRPVSGDFAGYPAVSGMAQTLAETLAGRFEGTRGAWVSETFQPLPALEREAVARFLP